MRNRVDHFSGSLDTFSATRNSKSENLVGRAQRTITLSDLHITAVWLRPGFMFSWSVGPKSFVWNDF